MSDQLFLAAIIGPFYLVFGSSVLIYSDVWKKIGQGWQKDHTSLIGVMLFSLIFGLAVITMHNVWEWSPFLIITLTGWSAFLKGTLYFLLPGGHWKSLIKRVNKKEYYQGMGGVAIVLGLWLSYFVYVA